MEELILRLEEVLKAEGNVYAALCNRLPLKMALIKRNQVQQLDRFVTQEEAELKKLAEWGQQREAMVSQLAERFSVAPRWSELEKALPASLRERLSPSIERLRAQAETLKEGNWQCEQLLQAALRYIDYSVNLIASAFAVPDTSYGEPEAQETPSLILDWIA